MKLRVKITCLLLLPIIFLSVTSINASAKMKDQVLSNMIVYKIRRGPTIDKDIVLKSFTVKRNTWITDKYVPKEGGWEISTKNFHPGKYVYYFALSEQWAWTNTKEVGSTSRFAHMSWVRNGNSKSWVWSKPGSGYKKFNISRFKHTIWTTDHEAQLMYGKKTIYFHVSHGKYSGWISHNSLKLAPHSTLTISPLVDNSSPRNADGSRAFYMNKNEKYKAIRFANNSNTLWVAFPDYGDNQYQSLFDSLDNFGNEFPANQAVID